MKLLKSLFIAIATVALAYATIGSAAAEQCQTLVAGQNHDAGTVCVSNDTDTLTITIETQNGWSMSETQLALGTSMDALPTNRPGNPMIGKFPHHTYETATSLTYVFDFVDLHAACDSNFYMAFHAVVSNGDQVETAWGDGEQFTTRGSWAMYMQYQAICPTDDDEPLVCTGSETGYAFGNVELNDLGAANRWGWAIEGIERGTDNVTATVWAGAGQNDTSKAHESGYIEYSFDASGWLIVDAYANPGYSFGTIHLFAGEGYPDRVASNGRFPHRLNESDDDDINLVTAAHFEGEIEGDVINMIVHFEVEFVCE